MWGGVAKAFGRWADDTEKIARRMPPYLEPEEKVLAAVYVLRPGTTSARIQGGASGATTGAVGADTGVFASGRSGREGTQFTRWLAQAEAVGIDPQLARQTIKLVVAVTTMRVLLIRRGYATGRMQELLAAWPLATIEKIAVPRNGKSLQIFREGRELRFELPNEHRFIAQVYRDLPQIFDDARVSTQGDEATDGR